MRWWQKTKEPPNREQSSIHSSSSSSKDEQLSDKKKIDKPQQQERKWQQEQVANLEDEEKETFLCVSSCYNVLDFIYLIHTMMEDEEESRIRRIIPTLLGVAGTTSRATRKNPNKSSSSSLLRIQHRHNHRRRRSHQHVVGAVILLLCFVMLTSPTITMTNAFTFTTAPTTTTSTTRRSLTVPTTKSSSLLLLSATKSSSSSDDNNNDEVDDSKKTINTQDVLFATTATTKMETSNDKSQENNNDLFASATSSSTSSLGNFGESVSIRQKPKSSDVSNNIGNDLLLDPSLATTSSSSSTSTKSTTSTSTSPTSATTLEEYPKRRNLMVAILSIVAALINYGWQFLHPQSPVQLLVQLQQQSEPLSVIGRNSKPTVLDIWAPWCENCKVMAPTMELIHREYAGKVNFVVINGDSREAWSIIDRFGVDAIPHMAMISSEGDVETALIGLVPKYAITADIDVLLENANAGTTKNNNNKWIPVATASASTTTPTTHKELPAQMLDVFANKPELRRVSFPLEED